MPQTKSLVIPALRSAARLLLLLSLLTISLKGQAQDDPREEIRQNPCLSGNNFLAYPGPQRQLTPAPKGYRPFCVSHYGRHGSRYLTKRLDYTYAYDLLRKADDEGVLTPLGRDVLQRLALIADESEDRHGDLTPLGQQQIRDIMRRMVERFPQVFSNTATVDARSTSVPRCILSMTSAVLELTRLRPNVNVAFNATYHDMRYMNYVDRELLKQAQAKGCRVALDAYCAPRQNFRRLVNSLISDSLYVKRRVNDERLAYYLFRVASSIQNTKEGQTTTLYDIFTPDELYAEWQMDNAYWFLGYGFSDINGGQQPFSQRFLLRKMVEQADSCLRLDHPSVNLRFGHDTMVLPLVCLMGLNAFGQTINDLEQLEQKGWVCYRIVPMACNVQMVFYKKGRSDGDILFKVLLNEDEATLPIASDVAPYYHWADARRFFLERLDSFQTAGAAMSPSEGGK